MSAPVGPQVALIGSVNRPAIFELKPGETVADVLRMAGGFSAVADRSRLAVERLDDRATVRIVQLALPGGPSRGAGATATCCAPSVRSTWPCRCSARTSACASRARCCGRATTCCRRRARSPMRWRAAGGLTARPSCSAPSSPARACARRSRRTTSARCATWKPISRAMRRRSAAPARPTRPPRSPAATLPTHACSNACAHQRPTGRVVLQLPPDEPRAAGTGARRR